MVLAFDAGTTRLNLESQSEPFGLLCSMSAPVALVSVEFVDGAAGVIGEYLIFAPVAGFVPGAAQAAVLVSVDVPVAVAAADVSVLLFADVPFVPDVLGEVLEGVVPDPPSIVPDAPVGQLVFGVAVVGVDGVVGVVWAPAGAANAPVRASAAARLNSRFISCSLTSLAK
jgi:hypothetical protein